MTCRTTPVKRKGPKPPPLANEGALTCTRKQTHCFHFSFHLGGERVGYAQLHALSETTVEVVDLFVEPAHRGNGYARVILERLLDFARSLGFSEICAHTSPNNGSAYRLFRGLDFHTCEAEEHLERPL